MFGAQNLYARQTPSFDIFYLAVGNSNYQKTDPAGTDSSKISSTDFVDVDGANKSARKMSSYLDRIGATYGITLISQEDKLVTRNDVFESLNNLLEKVKQTKAKNPLIVFYICGHGISEGIGWNHFSIPGNFSRPERSITVAEMSEMTIYTGEVADQIEKAGYQFILMLDSCYEGKEEPLSNRLLSDQLVRNLTDIFKILRVMNEFRGPGTAIFATKPGTLAQMADDPFDRNSAYGLGRIARRTLLIFERALKLKKSLTISEFIRQISDHGFDNSTVSVITRSVPGNPAMNLIRKINALTGPRNIIFGSGFPQMMPDKSVGENSFTIPADENILASPTSYLSFESSNNDFIGEGRSLTFTGTTYKISAIQNNRSEVSFSIENDKESWDISFAAPKGTTFQKGLYENAERSGFQTSGHPGFSFTGDSRACNEIRGRFNLIAVRWNANGKLSEFFVDFEQYCDGAESALKGKLKFSAASEK